MHHVQLFLFLFVRFLSPTYLDMVEFVGDTKNYMVDRNGELHVKKKSAMDSSWNRWKNLGISQQSLQVKCCFLLSFEPCLDGKVMECNVVEKER